MRDSDIENSMVSGVGNYYDYIAERYSAEDDYCAKSDDDEEDEP